jgi:hypothetical protein
MTSHIEEDTYKWPRRYIFALTLIVIVVIFSLPFFFI